MCTCECIPQNHIGNVLLAKYALYRSHLHICCSMWVTPRFLIIYGSKLPIFQYPPLELAIPIVIGHSPSSCGQMSTCIFKNYANMVLFVST